MQILMLGQLMLMLKLVQLKLMLNLMV